MKSVIIFVTHEEYDSYGDTVRINRFTESANVGKGCHYPSAVEIVKELQGLYTKGNHSSKTNRFTITNVVIE